MMQKRLSYFILFCLIACKLPGQVNLQTGSATFSLPIFNWQDNKSRLNSLIALSYNSGNGLRVNDLPSNVGQGWSLIAGGSIVRMQTGEPDDQWPKDGNEWDVTKYPPGILYASVPASQGCPTALTKYPIYGWKNQLYNKHNVVAEDKELDYFAFQFNGKAGMFVVDPTNIGNCKSLGDSKIKITFQQDAGLISQGIRTRITSFTIQDVDGLIYKFTKHGLTKILKSEYCDANLIQYQRQPNFKAGKVYHQAGFDNGQIINPWIIGSWYLTEIEDALTHRKIFFNYLTRNISNNAGEEVIYNQDKNYAIIFHKKSITQTPALSSITFPDGHTSTLNYTSQRLDLAGDYVLASIDILYQGRYLSRHELNTSYFILNRYGNPVSDFQKRVSRLCLLGVRKIGPDLLDDSPPYKFDYYSGSNAPDDFIPPPFSFAKDIWGFYNGDKTRGYWYETIPLTATLSSLTDSKYLRGICYLRTDVSGIYINPKTGYAKNGLLRQIIYPTGGTLTYEYEQNTGLLGGVNREVGGVHVSKTSSTDGGYSNGCANPMVTNYSYTLGSSGSASSLWGLEMPVNSRITNNHYQPERKYYKWSTSCLLGCCDWRYKYPGIESMQQHIDLKGFEKLMESISPVLGIISTISTIQDIITAFSGGSPVALVIDLVLSIAQIGITCIGNQEKNTSATIYYNSNLNDAAPLPTQFKRVEVIENSGGSSGGIGKTVQEFTSDDDYAIWEPTNPAFSAKQRFAPWAYGLPKNTFVYSVSGNLVKETNNFYSYLAMGPSGCGAHGTPCYPRVKMPLNINSSKCQVDKNSSERNTDWSDPNKYNDPASYLTTSNSDLKVDIYNVYTGRLELDSTIEKDFSNTTPSQYVSKKTAYAYNLDTYLPIVISKTASNGDVTENYIKYVTDYSYLGGIMSTLKQNNIIGLPVESRTGIYGPGKPYGYLNEKVTEFIQLSNGDIKPMRLLEQRFVQPIEPVYFSTYQGPGSNISNYKITQEFTYDASGNLSAIKDEGNRKLVNLYGYNEKYVTASVINADVATDNPAHTSFEVAGDFGKWIKTGNGSENLSTSITGAKSYNFVPGSKSVQTRLRADLNSAKPYIVSFWSTSSSVIVTGGATLTKTGPALNGFTYYEYTIAQGTLTLYLSGSGVVDEVRCYPIEARMTSTTYDPIIGKTSECDQNNRITYYEYDKMGRLQFVKDEKKNIVKTYEYNNISPSKQNGCPGLYYNRQVSETFSRNNCGSGYLGGEITFTVPANIYSSALSQADADAQAEAYILANGQNYTNTNGNCIPLFYNTQQSQNFTTESCGPGYIGATVTYTVPSGRYWSTISQADADQMALDEIEANGEAYANTPPNAECIIDSDPQWDWVDQSAWYCALVQGFSEPHLFIKETDMNPNSSSYLDTRWSDVGPSDLCPTGLYYNTTQSGVFIRNNCPPGYTGSSVTYIVDQGTYSSAVSQAAANQVAINDVNANGQNYANINGICTPSGGCGPYCESVPSEKCINNVCEHGILVNTNTWYDSNLGLWVCEFHYEWSDGSWSINYYETAPEPCMVIN